VPGCRFYREWGTDDDRRTIGSVRAAFGAGVTRARYIYELRFTAGVMDIASTSVPHDDSLRNRTFLVLFGVRR
jgi:hypothetical protein